MHTLPSFFLFQFTPLREGRLALLSAGVCKSLYFNSRPSARGDICTPPVVEWIIYFNSRPSARGDRAAASFINPSKYFNSCPSARGDKNTAAVICGTTNFNSRPSARGDVHRLHKELLQKQISIHAPPRGATCQYFGIVK